MMGKKQRTYTYFFENQLSLLIVIFVLSSPSVFTALYSTTQPTVPYAKLLDGKISMLTFPLFLGMLT